MRKLYPALFALTALAALTVFEPTAGRADPYKWCAVYNLKGGASNCGFVTLEQCRATISGVGGICEENQFYTGTPAKTAKHKRKHTHHYD